METLTNQSQGASIKPEPFSVSHWLRAHRAHAFAAYVVIAIIVFAVLLVLARITPYFQFDLRIEQFIQSLASAPMDLLMESISWIGFQPQSIVIAVAIIVCLFVMGWRWEAGMAAFAALGVTILGAGVKLYVQRARPTSDLVHVFTPLNDYSFPSGHVLYFTAFFGFLWFLLYTHAKPSWYRTVGLVIFALLIGLVGVSRIYLGQHWPSDVVGAYLLGSLWLALTIFIYRKFRTSSGKTPLHTAPAPGEAPKPSENKPI